MHRFLSVMTLGFAACTQASAQTRDFKPMIIGVLDAPAGEMSRTFGADTPWVKVMRQQYGTDGPITVTTKVVKRFKEQGCGRVEAAFLVQDAKVVRTSKTGLQDAKFNFQINVCRDGMPPVEGMDLRELQSSVSPPASNMTRIIEVPVSTSSQSATKVAPR
jgi:hypothetical protein